MNCKKEIWKDILGYEGLYQVSNLGRVKSLVTFKYSHIQKKDIIVERVKYLKQQQNKKGYMAVKLYKNKKKKNFQVHRLVMMTFIPNLENKPQVNHINGIKTDNRLENLEWCTNGENQKHAFENNLQPKNPMRIRKKVNQYDKQGKFIKTWESISQAERELGIHHISAVCRKKRDFAGNCIWRYESEVVINEHRDIRNRLIG